MVQGQGAGRRRVSWWQLSPGYLINMGDVITHVHWARETKMALLICCFHVVHSLASWPPKIWDGEAVLCCRASHA